MSEQDMNRSFYSVIQLSEHIYYDNDGMLVCEDAILGKAGTQTYAGYELGLDTDDLIVVHRPEEEVFHEESLASLKGKTLTLGHPDEDVSADNYSYLGKGFVLDVRRDGNLIRGDIKITDKEVMDLITSKEMVELSLGYRTKLRYVGNDELKQTNIAYNHIALVPRGRADVARIVDQNKTRVLDKQLNIERRNSKTMTKEEILRKVKEVFTQDELKSLIEEDDNKDEEVKAKDENPESPNEEEKKEGEAQVEDNKSEDEVQPKEPEPKDEESLTDDAVKKLFAEMGSKNNEPESPQVEQKETKTNDEDKGDVSKMTMEEKIKLAKEVEQIQDESLKAQLKNELFPEDVGDDSALKDFAGVGKQKEVEKFDFDKEYKALLDELNPHNPKYESTADYIKARQRIDKEARKETIEQQLQEVGDYLGGNQ